MSGSVSVFQRAYSLCRELPLIVVNHHLEISRLLSVDRASDRKACTKDLLCSALELPGLALGAHLTHHAQELILSDVAAVRDVLGLLAVTKWLLQVLDDEAGGVPWP